jgi:glycosyltransferase involved in cell wall biosynthesis
MRILEIETFGRGGLTHYVFNLSRALAARGHTVTVVTARAYELEGNADHHEDVEVRRRIGRFTAVVRRLLSGVVLRLALQVEAVFDALSVAATARRLRPDVIHLHCTNPAALVYLAALRIVRRPVVFTAHVVTPHEPIRLQQPIYRLIYRLCDVIVSHSRRDRQRLLDEFPIDADRVIVIPHGEYGFVERAGQVHDRDTCRRALGLQPADEVALFFGYVREYKGLDVLLEAWPAVVMARPAARLVLAGDPVQLPQGRRRELEAWAARVGAVCRLEYIPFSDVASYFHAADALVMPYRQISQSGVLFLGLSLGLPIVATTVGALPEVVEDGESAVLVPPESPDALSDALVRVLGDTQLRARLVAGGLRVARDHGWPAIAEQTDRLFARLVG